VRLRIAIDASRTTVARRTGTENYALQLIRALIMQPSPHEFTLYFRDPPPAGLFPHRPSVHHKVIPFPRMWTHLRFAAELWHDRPDMTFVPAHTLPYVFPGAGMVTLHDLGYKFFPEAHPARELHYLDQTTRYSARRADRILADSEATRRDLIAQYGVDSRKITVIYPGVEGIARASDTEIAAVRAKYGLQQAYLLFVGTLQPRKNLKRLIEAFHQADLPDHVLVLAGKPGWLFDRAIPDTVDRSHVLLPGYIPDSDIAPLYSGAAGFVFPSLYEGFGFPVVESMRCGTPVLCANTSSLPELAGDAAILVDPLDTNAIAEGMNRLVKERGDTRIAKGYQQAAQFTWNRAAEQILTLFNT
jgi:glycosyltransferase involved in cell wall biosynthesis